MRDGQLNRKKYSRDEELSAQGEAAVKGSGSVVFAALGVSAAALILAGALVLPALPISKAATINWHSRHVFSAVVIALVNNVDNLSARLAYSVQGTKVSLLVNAWISVITLLLTGR